MNKTMNRLWNLDWMNSLEAVIEQVQKEEKRGENHLLVFRKLKQKIEGVLRKPVEPIQALSNLYQTAAAHYEHLAENQENQYGRHRKSLYEMREERNRLLSVATSVKNAAIYLNSVSEKDISFNKLQNHLWDLSKYGGATGKAYLRAVDTLKCILLKIGCPGKQ